MTSTQDQTSDELAIDVRGLHKAYGSYEAVRGIDIQVAAGEVFALLGPNGAGKTTIVEILEGHRKQSGGQVSVLGYDPGSNDRAFKQRVGIVLQSTSVDQYLSVEETIDQFRGYYPSPLPLEELLDLVGLREQRRMRVKKLSGRATAAAGRRHWTGGRPGVAVSRRADHRLRPLRTTRGVGDGQGAEIVGQDGVADNTLHGRGRVPGRPRGDPCPWEDCGRRRTRRASAP